MPVAGLALIVLVAGCRSRNPDIGRACDAETPCPSGMLCLPDHADQTVCMEQCAADDGTTCADGALCLDTSLGERACWIGGPAGIGDACASHLDCEHGGICILITGTTEATCYRACTLGSSNDCFDDQRCVPTADGSDGFCAP